MAEDSGFSDPEVSIPQSPMTKAAFFATQSAGVGLLVSAVQNSLASHQAGAWGIFTRTGGTIAFFAGMGGIFAFTEAQAQNIRERNDAWNGAIGGCAAGILAGIRARSIPLMCSSCAGIGAVIGTFDAAGRSFVGRGSIMTREQKEEARSKFFKRKPGSGLPPSMLAEPE